MAGRSSLITFLRKDATGRNALNEPVGAWPDHGKAYAEVTPMTVEERTAAGMQAALEAARFSVRRNTMTAGITPADRLRYRGAVWEITAAGEGKPGRISITAKKREG